MTHSPHASEPTLDWSELDDRAVNTARLLAADAVQKAGHGHPGTAMSLAPAAYLIYQKLMRHDPADPSWIGRDRFVLSCGHSSLTQYIQLYLAGYPMTLEDLQSLRTWGSQTPGHPEYGHTPGVEVTTGPLGQGVANAVGMAMAARRERGLFDPFAGPGESPFDHDIYAICSDGDLQEGVSAEASSLAGLQQLGNLTVLYDDNKISIEDDTDVAFTEDVALRYEAYGWHVQTVDWTHGGGEYREDVHALADAFAAAKRVTDRPSLIVLRTIIAWPAPNAQNTGASHGSALGADEIKATKKLLGFDPEVDFAVADEVLEHTRQALERGEAAHEEWQTRFDLWVTANGERKALLDRMTRHELPEGWDANLPVYEPSEKGVATRVASGDFLTAAAATLPELWGGSADLAGSNNTTPKDQPSFLPPQNSTKKFTGDWYGRVLHFGIREHAMGSIMNGIALHGPTRPYGGTFLVFSDYMRPAVRLAALQELPVTYVWTHDSIGLGEDGPTHQPVEHLAALRTIPGLDVVRPADANETVAVWSTILQRHHRPAALALSRQNLPVFPRDGEYAPASDAAKGAYILLDSPADLHHATPDVILVATGSEVQLAVAARAALAEEGIAARVVSMPCREWFEEQDQAYRDSVIPPHVRARVAIEAAVAFGWRDIVGDAGRIVSLEHFGASASYSELYDRFGITAVAAVEAARESIQAAQHEGGVPVFARPTGPVLPDTTH
ncbi:transketolase [Aeromicrobium sp. 636]|uniref:Transketolase n=1 Tax=Aeromicrobium senzhongii TaxID=2663859 RepID=A0A8I0ESV9_9ACTN|nr:MULTISPECIES: transketolase [Aeromicrobium]MBC9224929.1 transketolase [Aeromicrobium senzhongii]MCQ3997041.1 transketolase [Aeromicrobium sp. 636]MTB86975.1 transketolase [Aeromicrobium senzhongii]QNL93198.1 transketolase [Aeromicrobium senzhongii]